MSLISLLEWFREASPDGPRGWTQGPKTSGGQITVRSKAGPLFSFEVVVGEGVVENGGVTCSVGVFGSGVVVVFSFLLG